jgi:hypothetical protein
MRVGDRLGVSRRGERGHVRDDRCGRIERRRHLSVSLAAEGCTIAVSDASRDLRHSASPDACR